MSWLTEASYVVSCVAALHLVVHFSAYFTVTAKLHMKYISLCSFISFFKSDMAVDYRAGKADL